MQVVGTEALWLKSSLQPDDIARRVSQHDAVFCEEINGIRSGNPSDTLQIDLEGLHNSRLQIVHYPTQFFLIIIHVLYLASKKRIRTYNQHQLKTGKYLNLGQS